MDLWKTMEDYGRLWETMGDYGGLWKVIPGYGMPKQVAEGQRQSTRRTTTVQHGSWQHYSKDGGRSERLGLIPRYSTRLQCGAELRQVDVKSCLHRDLVKTKSMHAT